ncbi:RNA polymerase sigma-I factor [Metaplanococcus flavidus]|uniref:RNA polymerase sigma factor SigI n=1 Tax=Metaplanococcus flavidus TaxID=569883 RepID=A0ABW3LAN7_9BACL
MLLSVFTGYFNRGDKKDAETLAILAQNGDTHAMDHLLFSYAPFMKKTAGQVCKKFINDQDEEFSIAMSAFHEAINGFNQEKNASFLTFAHMVIRRRIIDFIRKENSRNDFSHDFHGSAEEENSRSGIDALGSVRDYTEKQQAVARREEIAEYEKMLANFDMTFQDLVEASPSHEDARITAVQIAQLVAETEEYWNHLQEKKKLPVKEIEKLVEVSRKTIERNRKYIIAVAILMMSDLHYLKDYLKERLR